MPISLSFINPIFTSIRQFARHSIQSFSLQNIFNTLINSFIENKVGIAEKFLSESLASHLKENLTNLYTQKNSGL